MLGEDGQTLDADFPASKQRSFKMVCQVMKNTRVIHAESDTQFLPDHHHLLSDFLQ